MMGTKRDLLEAQFEQAMIAVTKARDGSGWPVRLHDGDLTAASLRESTFVLMEGGGRGAVHLSMSKAAPEDCEIAYWENLALLARATAAAIRYEQLPVLPNAAGSRPLKLENT